VEHGLSVWNHVAHRDRAKRIAIVAFSYGGRVAEEIVCLSSAKENRFSYLQLHAGDIRCLQAVCLIDSFMHISMQHIPFMVNIRNWVCSTKPSMAV
jgi:hypothetical protein